jgi:hypothetical protein
MHAKGESHFLLNKVQFSIDYNYYLLGFVNKVSFLDYIFNWICTIHNQLIVMQNDWNNKSYGLLKLKLWNVHK